MKKFQVETYEGLDAIIPLPEVDLRLTLAQVYQRIKFMPEQLVEE